LAGAETVEVALVRPTGATGARKRIRVNGVARRAGGLAGLLRTVVFAPEEMLLVAGSPGLRRAALDQLATQRSAAYGRDLATYGRTLQQRNSLLRAIREEQAGRDELRFWDESFLDAGGAIVAERQRLLADLAGPLARAHAEIAPDEADATRLAIAYATNAPALPGESPRDALARRLAETAEKEVWNGSTLVGPHRDDLVFTLDGRDMSGFASRGQQRTAILAFKLAELDLLTEQDGRPPLLLLDDVFSELDPDRRSHLVRRIAGLPQAFVTTTTLDDLDPALVDAATAWEVVPDAGGGAALRSIEAPGKGPARRPGAEPDAPPVAHAVEP
jgi:DNA replication and repair protein RecF